MLKILAEALLLATGQRPQNRRDTQRRIYR